MNILLLYIGQCVAELVMCFLFALYDVSFLTWVLKSLVLCAVWLCGRVFTCVHWHRAEVRHLEVYNLIMRFRFQM